jgi:hypothetical protein
MGRARKKQQPDEASSLDRVYGLRDVNAATNDNDEGDAIVDELHEDAWRTPISDSTVVRKAKGPRCNPVRIVPFQRRAELPSVRPGGWWQCVTPDREGPIVDSVTGLDVRTVDDLTPGQPRKLVVAESYVRDRLEWASGQPCSSGWMAPELRDVEVRNVVRHLVEDCVLPLDLKALIDNEYPLLWTAYRYVVEYDIDDQKRKPPEEPIRALTDAEREILRTHGRLVVSLAAKLSRGYKGFNHDRFADLMYVGLVEMVKRIPRYNPARKVTIGAYLGPFIYGAMEEHLDTRLPTSSMARTNDIIKQLVDENIDRWKRYDGLDELDYISQHKRLVAAGKKAASRKARAEAKAKRKPEPDIPVASGNTAGQFTAQQYQVYLNLHEPNRFNQTEMAKRLGVSRTRYRQILTDVNRIWNSNLL